MDDIVKYEIGSKVFCRGDHCGELNLVVVDPVGAKLAHLIVQPHSDGEPRLVPVSLAQAGEDGDIHLDCTADELDKMDPAVRAHFIPLSDSERRWGYRHDEIVSWPYFGLGPTGPNLGLAAPEPVLMPQIKVEDQVPLGEVRIHKGDRVHASDGDIGRVRGLVVDPSDDAVTHVLLDEGHLWGRKRIAIPVGLVGGITDEGVSVRLTKQQIKDLPPVDILGLD